MSNATVGATYKELIERVISSSQNDFEEWGVDQQTLQQLQQSWQKRLSSLKTASFPWDPAPVPEPATRVVPSNAPPQQVAAPQQPAQAAANGQGQVRIKQEPGYDSNLANYPGQNGYSNGVSNPQLASQRAAALAQQQFGNQANASIAALHQAQSGLPLPGQQVRPQNLQYPAQPVQQYQQRPPQSGYPPQQMPPQPGQPPQQRATPLSAAQTDGSGDADAMEQWKALVAERRAVSAEDREHADHFFRQQLEEMSRQMDSGLMLPLDEQPSSNGKKRAIRKSTTAAVASVPVDNGEGPSTLTVPQLDGADSEDEKVPIEDDEDAINSDLDDPEDDLAQADDDEQDLGELMLCTYDKVQRVKNKWKCTLKDGVLQTNGKEYLFHKAQGEFEW